METRRSILRGTSRRKSARKNEQCATAGCQEQAVSKGRCSACYVGLARLYKRIEERGLQYIGTYVYRMNRLTNRGEEVQMKSMPRKRRAA